MKIKNSAGRVDLRKSEERDSRYFIIWKNAWNGDEINCPSKQTELQQSNTF